MADKRQLSPQMLKEWGRDYDNIRAEKEVHAAEQAPEVQRGDRAPIGDIVPTSPGKADVLERVGELRSKPKTTNSKLLELIGGVESRNGYNFEYGNKPVALDKMTIGEVLEHQKKRRGQGAKSSAVGRYQFIYETLEEMTRKNPRDLPRDAKFTPQMQDKAATILMERRGLSQYQSGQMDEQTFAKNLSKEWAALPDPSTGKSYYDKDGLNKSLTSVDELLASIRGIRQG